MHVSSLKLKIEVGLTGRNINKWFHVERSKRKNHFFPNFLTESSSHSKALDVHNKKVRKTTKGAAYRTAAEFLTVVAMPRTLIELFSSCE